MIQELVQSRQGKDFPNQAPCAYPVFYRTYSRQAGDNTVCGRETWQQVCDRTTKGLTGLGDLTTAEVELVTRMQRTLKALPSGRWLWVGGTGWILQSENYSGAYNCTSTNVVDWTAFGLMMDLAMMGCGTGAVLEPQYIQQLPTIRNRLTVSLLGLVGQTLATQRQEETTVAVIDNQVTIKVGDSRQGWVRSYQTLLELAGSSTFGGEVQVLIDLSDVRPAGEPLQGFGGVSNPVKLASLYERCAAILNKASGRQLNSVECCLLIDEAAVVIVAGNIRRSAGMRQFLAQDELAAQAKANLWQQDNQGNWRIDPERDALRMANHTRIYHHKPSLEECTTAVRQQYYSGEGAIQYAPEAIARANADLLHDKDVKEEFLEIYTSLGTGEAQRWLQHYRPEMAAQEVQHRLQRYGLNPCGEIIGSNYFCNLAEIHLNQLDPNHHQEQEEAFRAGALTVATLLNHQFVEPRYQVSRQLDPIVGVSITGLFDFFVEAFGVEWLCWWSDGRPTTDQGQSFKQAEIEYLKRWRDVVHNTVWDYCDRHHLKRPNRCTTVQPAGTKSLLTGASPGWHPPKAQRFIRRITFRKHDPVALACIDYGYTVVPSQSDKDEQGHLLTDPFDPRCTEWLVEIPTEVPWANLPGADTIDISQFSALAQFDFYMTIQKHYTRHNTSATIELRESEIEPLGQRIYQAIHSHEGYISAALLARFDDQQTFPRLPFEPISKEQYQALVQQVEARRQIQDFHQALNRYDAGYSPEAGPAGCDSDKCMLPEPTKP